MIMFWNRREIFMGYSLEKFYEVRQSLEANQIKYTYKLAGTGNKNDYDFACGMLRSR